MAERREDEPINDKKPKFNFKFAPKNKLIFIIIVICGVVGIAGVFGYMYFEGQIQAQIDTQKEKDRQTLLAQQQADAQALANQQAQAQAQLQQQQAEAQAQLQAQQKANEIQQEKQNIITQSAFSPILKGEMNGQLTFYIPPVPSYASADAQAHVNDAISKLNGHSWFGVNLVYVTDPSQADITIQWVKDYSTDRLGSYWYRVAQVGVGMPNCLGTWEPFNGQSLENILWHEFGHALGFNHTTDPNNIMYGGFLGETFAIDYDQSQTISQGNAQAYTFCGTGTYQIQVTSYNPNDMFDVYLVAPAQYTASGIQTSMQQMMNHNGGLYYPSCSSENIQNSYIQNCSPSKYISNGL
jgi:flagellar basal body-associated protein FliL